jgi:glyoxylase-like metal-dependent hydrolase (beta-lactamase superfamily II)
LKTTLLAPAILLPALAFALAAMHLALASPLLAQPTVSGESWQTLEYGDLTVTAFSDRTGTMPYSIFFDISAEDFAALAKAGGSPSEGELASWINFFLVEKGDRVFLVDTGVGAGPGIVPLLRAAGREPGTVTDILITHFHGDHIGGLLDKDGGTAFPAATLHTPRRDEEYFIPADGTDVPGTELARKVTLPYRDAGRYQAFEPGGRMATGVKSSSLWGHTPGHTGFLFESSRGPFLAWGDIVHAYLVQFARPEVTLSYDVDRPAAAETRRRVFNEAADTGYLVAGAHLPFPGVGQVTRQDGAFSWIPFHPAGAAGGGGASGGAPVE